MKANLHQKKKSYIIEIFSPFYNLITRMTIPGKFNFSQKKATKNIYTIHVSVHHFTKKGPRNKLHFTFTSNKQHLFKLDTR